MAQTLTTKKTVNDPQEREKAILQNKPALFEIKQRSAKKENSIFDGIYEATEKFYVFDSWGIEAVRKHDKTILKYAQKHNLDPDMIRAVMYSENSRGHKLGLNYLSDAFGLSESPEPMNIQKGRWSALIGKKPEDMYDADNNIEASAVLLKRIAERIEKPTPEKVASVWNYIGRETTNDFGEYVGEIYRQKPWKKIDK